MGRIVIWIVGFALLSVIYVAAIHFKANDIESDLKARSKLALVNKGFSWANVSVTGRDVILKGSAPDLSSVKKIKEVTMSVWGIRTVDCRCKVVTPPAAPNELTPETVAKKDLSETEMLNTVKESVAETEEKPTHPEMNTHDSAEQCQNDMDELLKERSIEFASGSRKISNKSLPLLKKLVAITQSCPTRLIKISGHTDDRGNAEKNNLLSLERAGAVLDYFHEEGVSVARLKAVGYGDSSPIDSNTTEEGRRRNRRIEFRITP